MTDNPDDEMRMLPTDSFGVHRRVTEQEWLDRTMTDPRSEPDPEKLKAAEIRDLDARLAALRAASRPSEPLEEPRILARDVTCTLPSAQGHITSAITQLERRRAELLGRKG